MAEFQAESPYRGRSLLVERYDIPDRRALGAGAAGSQLSLQEDACLLLLLRRDEKYKTSLERIAEALLAAGIRAEDERAGMRRFLQLALFSWMVGNGDIHAKNVSVLRRFRTGRPGEPPVLENVEHAPFYDLVNTRLHLPGDDFALPVDVRRRNLRLKNFVALARRWETPAHAVREEAETIAEGLRMHLDAVLVESGLPTDLVERYQAIVGESMASFGSVTAHWPDRVLRGQDRPRGPAIRRQRDRAHAEQQRAGQLGRAPAVAGARSWLARMT